MLADKFAEHHGSAMESHMRNAVITGGTGSLGQATAETLKVAGWSVEALSSSDLDVRDSVAVRNYFHDREVDLLVCAAGITRDAPIARMTQGAWDDTWSVNFQGSLACADAVLPRMIARECGHIIFISSYSALHPPIGQIAYGAAKAALLGLVTDLAQRHGASNIRVNAILPGFFESRMTSNVTEPRRKEILASHYLGRFNTCDRVAAFIQFLHENLPHTSGQIFQLDSR